MSLARLEQARAALQREVEAAAAAGGGRHDEEAAAAAVARMRAACATADDLRRTGAGFTVRAASKALGGGSRAGRAAAALMREWKDRFCAPASSKRSSKRKPEAPPQAQRPPVARRRFLAMDTAAPSSAASSSAGARRATNPAAQLAEQPRRRTVDSVRPLLELCLDRAAAHPDVVMRLPPGILLAHAERVTRHCSAAQLERLSARGPDAAAACEPAWRRVCTAGRARSSWSRRPPGMTWREWHHAEAAEDAARRARTAEKLAARRSEHSRAQSERSTRFVATPQSRTLPRPGGGASKVVARTRAAPGTASSIKRPAAAGPSARSRLRKKLARRK